MKKHITVNFGSAGLLGVVLIILKATGYIDWSWFWVLTPYWLPLLFFIGFLSFTFFLFVLVALLGGTK